MSREISVIHVHNSTEPLPALGNSLKNCKALKNGEIQTVVVKKDSELAEETGQITAPNYTSGLNVALKKCSKDLICIVDSSLAVDESSLELALNSLEGEGLVIGLQGDEGTTAQAITCSWFDILKYWVPGSVPMFLLGGKEMFARYSSSAEACFDGRLDVAGMYDFLVRTCFREPFKALEIPVRAGSLTGSNPAALISSSRCSAEGSRVFNRAFYQHYVVERSVSIVIPIHDQSTDLKSTFESILKQNQRNFEVVVCDNCSNPTASRNIQASLERFQVNWPQVPVRFVKGTGSEDLDILRDASDASAAPILAVVHPGAVLAEDFCVHVEAVFMADSVGFAFPLRNSNSSASLLCPSVHQVQVFNLESLFSVVKLPRCYVMRKIAYLDAEHFSPCVNTVAGLRDVLIRLMGKGWFISDGLELEVTDSQSERPAPELDDLSVWGTCLTAQLIVDIAVEQEQFDVAKKRAQKGMSLTFDQEVIDAAKGYLMDVPPQWWQYKHTTEESVLKNILERYPAFVPGWERLAQSYEASGDEAAALEARRQIASAIDEAP